MPFAIKRRVKSYSSAHPPSSPNTFLKLLKRTQKTTKKKPSKYLNTTLPDPAPIRQMAVVGQESQLFFHLNANPRPAFSSFACWEMLIAGVDFTSGGRGQPAPTRRRRPASSAPATTADSEPQGGGGASRPPHDPGSMAAPPSLLGPHLPVHPFLISKKEAFLSTWVLGKFKETTLLQRGLSGFPSLSRMWLGALTCHCSLLLHFFLNIRV